MTDAYHSGALGAGFACFAPAPDEYVSLLAQEPTTAINSSSPRFGLSKELLIIRTAAEGFEVGFPEFTGKGPADFDDGREGGDELVGERLRFLRPKLNPQ